MQVNGVLGEHARILENDWPNGRLTPPVGKLLVLLAWSAEAVEGCRPTRVGRRASVEQRKFPDWSTRIVGFSASGSASRISREHDSAARNGTASKPAHARDASSRFRQRSICAFRSS